jgi:hypothetical protein
VIPPVEITVVASVNAVGNPPPPPHKSADASKHAKKVKTAVKVLAPNIFLKMFLNVALNIAVRTCSKRRFVISTEFLRMRGFQEPPFPSHLK